MNFKADGCFTFLHLKLEAWSCQEARILTRAHKLLTNQNAESYSILTQLMSRNWFSHKKSNFDLQPTGPKSSPKLSLHISSIQVMFSWPLDVFLIKFFKHIPFCLHF